MPKVSSTLLIIGSLVIFVTEFSYLESTGLTYKPRPDNL